MVGGLWQPRQAVAVPSLGAPCGVAPAELLVIGGDVVVHVALAMVGKYVGLAQTLGGRGERTEEREGGSGMLKRGTHYTHSLVAGHVCFQIPHTVSKDSIASCGGVRPVGSILVPAKRLTVGTVTKIPSSVELIDGNRLE